MTPPPSFPPPDSADDDDTRWALTTAAALWKSGRYRDALPWVQRAAAAAGRASGSDDPKSNVRVVQLTVAAAELAAYVDAWSAGDASVEPSSIPISIELDTDSVDVLSIHSEMISEVITPLTPAPPVQTAIAPPRIQRSAPKTDPMRTPRLDVPRIPRPEPRATATVGSGDPRAPVAPRAQTFAGTLEQAERPRLPPTTVPVAVPRIPAPRPEVVVRSGRRVLAATLPEAVQSPLAPASTPSADPFAGLDEARLSSGVPGASAPQTTPAPSIELEWGSAESVPTRRMEDVPTRRATAEEIDRDREEG